MNVLIELLNVFNEAVVVLTLAVNVFELVANVLNTEELRKGVTTANDEVVANPKLVIWAELLIVPNKDAV